MQSSLTLGHGRVLTIHIKQWVWFVIHVLGPAMLDYGGNFHYHGLGKSVLNLELRLEGSFCVCTQPVRDDVTENKSSSIWQLCRHWWHRKLSLRQLAVPPVTKKLSNWRSFVSSGYNVTSSPIGWAHTTPSFSKQHTCHHSLILFCCGIFFYKQSSLESSRREHQCYDCFQMSVSSLSLCNTSPHKTAPFPKL